MARPKFTLTERQFCELRKTLAQRETNRYQEENVDAAYDVLVRRLPIRVAAERTGRNLNTIRRVTRELWCLAHGLTKWDLYLNRIPSSLAARAGIKTAPRGRSQPSDQRCLHRLTRPRSREPGWKLLIQRKIDGKLLHVVAFFADSAYEGEAGALEAARARRDEVEKSLPSRRPRAKPSLLSPQTPPGPWAGMPDIEVSNRSTTESTALVIGD